MTDIGFTFATNGKPSGLLGACTTSREVILAEHTAYIVMGTGGKIRFDGQNGTVMILGIQRAFNEQVAEDVYRQLDRLVGVKTVAVRSVEVNSRVQRIFLLAKRFKGLERLYHTFVWPTSKTFDYEAFFSQSDLEIEEIDYERVIQDLRCLDTKHILTAQELEVFCKERVHYLEEQFRDGPPGWITPEIKLMRLVGRVGDTIAATTLASVTHAEGSSVEEVILVEQIGKIVATETSDEAERTEMK